MIEKTRHAHTNYALLKPFVDSADGAGGAVRFKSSGFMDLVIENLYTADPYGNPMYSVTHYDKQNGDLMADPDMIFSISKTAERVIPFTFRNDYMGTYQEVLKVIHGKQMYRASLLRELDEFLWQWLHNIYDQGFAPGRFESVSA